MRGFDMRARSLLLVPAVASAIACTLIDSRDGIVGPPLRDGGPIAESGSEASLPDADAGLPTADAGDAGDAGNAPVSLYSGRSSPAGIAVFGSGLYWVELAPGGGNNAGLLAGMTAGGGTPTHLEDDNAPPGDAFDLAFDGTYVYWGDRSNGLVWRRQPGTAGNQQCFSGAASAAYLALGNGGVWVTDFRQDDSGVGTVVFGPCPGSALVEFSGPPPATGIGVAMGSLAWAWGTPSELETAAFGGTATMLNGTPAPTGPITGVAADGDAVYFIESNQLLRRFDLTSHEITTLYDAGQDFGESDVAVDDSAIYWTEQKNGLVRKLSKP